MTGYTVPTFLIGLLIGLALQPALNIVKVNAWHIGIARFDPWRMKASLLGAGAAAASWFRRLFTWRRGLRLLAALALLAVFADDAHGVVGRGAVLLAVTPIAEPTLGDVKSAIEESNRAWNEFKTETKNKLTALEAGRAVDPLITTKLEKLNAAMDAQAKVNEDFMALQASVNKLQLMNHPLAKDGQSPAEQLMTFNMLRRGHGAQAEATLEEYKAYCDAFEKLCRRGERGLTPAEQKALTAGSDQNGGYLIAPDKSGRLVTRIFETSPMRQYASVQPISTDSLEGEADLDEATFGWVSETGARTDTATPKVPAPWRIPVHEGYSQPKASQKLIEDSFMDIGTWLNKKVGDRTGRGQNTAFTTGTGVGKPRGFASYSTAATADGARAWGVFEHTLTGTASSFGVNPNGIQKIVTMMHTLKDAYAVNAAFYSNRLTRGAARLLNDGAGATAGTGNFLFLPSMVAGMPDQFVGYPYRVLQDMADYTTSGALGMAFGDMLETYQIVDRLGLSLLIDPYTAKPYVVFYTRFRVGGDVVNFESMKFLKFT